MPIYEYKCDGCEAEKEVMLPRSEAGQKQPCDCGLQMRQKFSPVAFNMPVIGRDKVLGTLNREEGGYRYPGGEKHGPRYDQAMAKGLERQDHQQGKYRQLAGAPA